MLKFHCKVLNVDEISAAFKKAPAEITAASENVVATHLEVGATEIKERYRSGPTTTPQRTKSITGNLRAVYHQHTKRKGICAIESEFGGLRVAAKGKVLQYLPVHELGSKYVDPRPPGGAIKLTMARMVPEIQHELADRAAAILRGAA